MKRRQFSKYLTVIGISSLSGCADLFPSGQNNGVEINNLYIYNLDTVEYEIGILIKQDDSITYWSNDSIPRRENNTVGHLSKDQEWLEGAHNTTVIAGIPSEEVYEQKEISNKVSVLNIAIRVENSSLEILTTKLE